MYKYFLDEVKELNLLIKNLDKAFENSNEKLASLAISSLNNKGKILFCGNGGSAADSQHLAAELVVRFENFRQSIPALALTVDTSIITACANDYSYEEIFSRQVESLAQENDLLICISTSGESINVHNAAKMAKRKNLKTVLLTSTRFKGDNEIREIYDLVVPVPSQITSTIQTCHIMIGHALCRRIEQELL